MLMFSEAVIHDISATGLFYLYKAKNMREKKILCGFEEVNTLN